MFATGHCLCGAISFTAKAPPIRMAQCHCEDCRRMTGTGHHVQAFFKSEDLAINGQPAVFENVADSGSERRRSFCAACGSTLFSERNTAPGVMGIAAGAFDNSDWFTPGVVLYASQRPQWDPELPGIQANEKM
ncbi:GFA family protein [Pelagibacterium sp.]|uniref:GFA family protein n=1 Tax=Pelagibacterium sp. TaxID=1967288 RepID=UPI003A8D534F